MTQYQIILILTNENGCKRYVRWDALRLSISCFLAVDRCSYCVPLEEHERKDSIWLNTLQ